MKINLFTFFILSILSVGCNDGPTAKLQKLEAENAALKSENERLKKSTSW